MGPSDSTYEGYVAGHYSIRSGNATASQVCGFLRKDPYFAPEHQNSNADYHLGGKRSYCTQDKSPTTCLLRSWNPPRDRLYIFGSCWVDLNMRTGDLRLFHIQMQYITKDSDVILRGKSTSTHEFRKANRKEQDPYRPRIEGGTMPREVAAGRMVCQAMEFNTMREKLRERENARRAIDSQPFRPPGDRPFVRISPHEAKRLAFLSDRIRGRDERKRKEVGDPNPLSSTCEPQYPQRWKKAKDQPNGHMRTMMYDGKPLVCLFTVAEPQARLGPNLSTNQKP